MKLLFPVFLLLAVSSFGAVPAYTSFRGAGGITVVSNPPTGTIVIDGSGVVASGTNSSMQVSTNNVASSTMASNINFTAGTNLVLRGTNIGSTAHINYSLADSVSIPGDLVVRGPSLFLDEVSFDNSVVFNGMVAITNGATNGFVLTTDGSGNATWLPPVNSGTNIGVGQTLYLDKTFGVDATAARTNLVRTFQTPSNAVAAILSGDTLRVRGGAYPINPKADAAGEAVNWNFQAGVSITNKSNISIVGEAGAVWYMSAWRSNNLKFSAPMLRFENCTNVVVENMTFIGLRTNAVVLGHGGVVLHRCSEITFRNCTFSNWQDHGVVFDDNGGTYGKNSHLNFIDNTFADIGGTNHVTLTYDGVAIGAGGGNINVIRNHFYRNLRDIEYCCDEDTRKVQISLNTSEGCYFDHIMITGTNSSEIIISDNIVNGYANFILPGASADGSGWIKTYAGSNITVQGNIVGGFANGIVASPIAGGKLVDWKILDNHFVAFSGIPIAFPGTDNNMVGFSTTITRNIIRGNSFMYCPSGAIRYSGNNSAINDNTFVDCNLDAHVWGVVTIGWPTAGVATNSANISLVGNKLVSSAANAGPGIVIYGMSSSNTVHGNEIDRKFATNIHNLGVGTRTRPVNLVAAGSLLRSDTNGNERAVVFGSGVAWDGSTGTLTGTGGGSGTQNIQTNGIPVSDSATGTVYFAGQNIQHFATNASGRVSVLTRTPTNLTFISSGGDTHILGWFINDSGGGGYGTGTNFGFYDVSADLPLFWTHGSAQDMYFQNDIFAPSMDGIGEVVVKAGLGKLQVTNVVNLSNVNAAVVYATNLQTSIPDGQVVWSSNGFLNGEAAFTYDRGDDTLTVTSLFTHSIAIFQNAGAGKVLTDVSGNGVGTWQYPGSGQSYITNIAAFTETFSGTLANWEVESDATWAIVGGKLLGFAGSAIQGRFLKYTNYWTMFPFWTMTCQITPFVTGTSWGLGFGIRSGVPDADYDANTFFDLTLYTGGAGSVQVYTGSRTNLLIGPVTGTNLSMTIADGNPIDITLTRVGNTWKFYASNTVDATRTWLSYSSSLRTNTMGYEPMAGHFALWPLGGSNFIDNITFTLNPVWPVTTLCVGDSITSGIGCDDIMDTWPNVLSFSMHDEGIQPMSAQGMRVSWLNYLLPEVALLAPSNIVMMIGGNDVGFGVAAATWQSNYNHFVSNASKNGGIWHCLPTPRNAIAVNPLVQWMTTNFPYSSVVDTFGPFKQTNTSPGLRIEYDSLDGGHPNRNASGTIARLVERALRRRP